MIRFDRASIARGGQIVVESLTAAWPAGRAVALVGRSGAGKTALLAAAAAALPLHAGEILIEGRSVRREADAVRRLVGYAPAVPPAWPGLRAGEFLELFAATAGLRGTGLRAAVDRGLSVAGLAGEPRAALETLAAAPAKMLLVARALLHDPRVLVLDDPFAGLDPAGRGHVERIIDDARLAGRTVLAAIDDARVPDCFTDLAVLREGRLVAGGANDPRAFAAGRLWACRIVCPAASEPAARVLAAHAADVHVVDADTVAFRQDPARQSLADLIGALVRAGIAVEESGVVPPWTVQLLDG